MKEKRKMKALPCTGLGKESLYFTIIIVFSLFASVTFSQIISSSKIESCVVTDGNTTLTECSKKLVVNLVLSEAQSTVQSIVTLTKASGSNGGQDVYFKSFSVGISKSETVYLNPIRYIQSVNNKPYELVLIKPGILGLIDTCSADFGSPATCGYYIDPQTKKDIPDSQVSY